MNNGLPSGQPYHIRSRATRKLPLSGTMDPQSATPKVRKKMRSAKPSTHKGHCVPQVGIGMVRLHAGGSERSVKTAHCATASITEHQACQVQESSPGCRVVADEVRRGAWGLGLDAYEAECGPRDRIRPHTRPGRMERPRRVERER